MSDKIVITLLQNLPRFNSHKLCFDSWYTSVDLIEHLYDQVIVSAGAVSANCLTNCKMTPDAAMKKKDRTEL